MICGTMVTMMKNVCIRCCKTQSYRGSERVAEIMRGHPRRFKELLRLTQPAFLELVRELKEEGLKDEKDVTVEEKVMYALMVLG